MTLSPVAMAWLVDRLRAEPAGLPAPDLGDTAAQQALFDAVRHHRLGPALPDAVIGDPAVPPELRLRLAELRRRRRLRALRLAAETGSACAALAAAGLPHVVLKGAAAGALLHGDVGARDALDVDLLVPRDALSAAAAALAPLGYRRVFGPEDAPGNRRPPPVALFRNEDAAGVLEVHTELADDLRLFPLARPFDTAVTVRLGLHAVPSLPREVALVYAAFHGWKHFWAQLVWLTDMAAAARHPALDWPAALDVARALGCERHLALAMLLARDLLGVPLPGALAAEPRLLAAVEGARARLAPLVAGADLLEGADPAYRMGLFATVRWDVRLHSRGEAKLAALHRHLRPTADDRKMMRLPSSLYPLYYGLRIGRLLTRALRGRRSQPERN